MTDKLLKGLENKLKEMEIEGLEFQEKIRTLLHKRKPPQVLKPLSYFNYSTIIDKQPTIIGTFHFQNQTALPVHNPIILFKISADRSYDFSGRYLLPNKPIPNESFFWERIENKHSDPMKEYSFRPVANKIIQPNETFSFSNFQIRFSDETSGYLHVEGFIYCEEIMEGMASLNSISINY